MPSPTSTASPTRSHPLPATDLQPGQAAALTLALNRKGKRLLRKAGKGKVKLAATAADLLDNRSSAKRKVKLKRQRK